MMKIVYIQIHDLQNFVFRGIVLKNVYLDKDCFNQYKCKMNNTYLYIMYLNLNCIFIVKFIYDQKINFFFLLKINV